MKLKKAKKGFTLVELVVVIAIIAVLSTVSVVGYFGFTKKANVSGDKALVSQLNTILKADQATNGKAETPTEAIEAVKESGYLVEKLAAKTSKYKIVWNQKDNEFALLDEEEKAVAGKVSSNAYENWVFADSYNAGKGYSVYLNSGYSGNSTLNITTGLDVGENTNVEVVNYTNTENAKHVVIRTNGGELTVNAPLDTVEHYEKADKVVITSIANESFHEYGIIDGNITLKEGHVVLENNSKVDSIVLDTNDIEKISVTQEEKATIDGTIIALDENVKSELTTSSSIQVKNEVIEAANDVLLINSDEDTANNNLTPTKSEVNCFFTADVYCEKLTMTFFKIRNKDVFYREKFVFDLNGHTFTLKSIGVNGSDVTFKNGNLIVENNDVSEGETAITVQSFTSNNNCSRNGKLSLVNVNLTTNKTTMRVNKNSDLYFNNSRIEANAHYIITSNASNIQSNTPVLNVTAYNSEFVTKTDDYDNAPIYLNVPSNLYFENCIFNGGRQAAIIRGGNATFKNCTLSVSGKFSSENDYLNSDWGEGNELPTAALVIGNRTETAYDYSTTVTLLNTTLKVLNNEESVYALYAYGKTKSNYTISLSYDSNSNLGKNNLNYEIGNVSVKNI